MYQLFYDLIYSQLFGGGDFIDSIATSITTESGGVIYFSEYLSILLALICTITVYVCCCLIVAKIVKTVANVFRG